MLFILIRYMASYGSYYGDGYTDSQFELSTRLNEVELRAKLKEGLKKHDLDHSGFWIIGDHGIGNQFGDNHACEYAQGPTYYDAKDIDALVGSTDVEEIATYRRELATWKLIDKIYAEVSAEIEAERKAEQEQFLREEAARKAKAEAAYKAKIEAEEREQLARLKAKYEGGGK